MALSYYLANKLLDHVMRNVAYTSPATVYLALFTTMPALDGTGGVEVAGGSYVRKAVTSGAPVLGVAASSASVTFAGMPAAVLAGVCLMDALAAGNMLQTAPYALLVTVVAGSDFVVPAADVVAVLR